MTLQRAIDDLISENKTLKSILQRRTIEIEELTQRIAELKDEGKLLDLILEHADVLTCYDCGEKLTENHNHVLNFDSIGIIHLDPGSWNYPLEPNEPAGIYFECMECFKSNKYKVKNNEKH